MIMTVAVGLYMAFRQYYSGGSQEMRDDLKECANDVKALVDSCPVKKYSNKDLTELFASVVTNNPTRNKYHPLVFLSFCAYTDIVNGDKFCYQYVKSMPDISEMEL